MGIPKGAFTKTATAIKLLEAGPVISAQVVNETVAILTRKYRFSLPDAHQVATSLLVACEVVPVDADTIREAIRLTTRYKLSHWDSLSPATTEIDIATSDCVYCTPRTAASE